MHSVNSLPVPVVRLVMKLREEDKEEEWFALTEKIVANSLCIMLSEVES